MPRLVRKIPCKSFDSASIELIDHEQARKLVADGLARWGDRCKAVQRIQTVGDNPAEVKDWAVLKSGAFSSKYRV